jgi:hypothetical protein
MDLPWEHRQGCFFRSIFIFPILDYHGGARGVAEAVVVVGRAAPEGAPCRHTLRDGRIPPARGADAEKKTAAQTVRGSGQEGVAARPSKHRPGSVGMIVAPVPIVGLLVFVGLGEFVLLAVIFGEIAVPGLIFPVVPMVVVVAGLVNGNGRLSCRTGRQRAREG